MLSIDQLKAALFYDPYTGVFVWKIDRGGGARVGRIAGGLCHGYVRIRLFGRYYPAHRLAWIYTHGVPPSGVIDHIDHNTSNNMIDNLRDVTHAENIQNMRTARRDNKAGYLGVRVDSQGGYTARITKDRQTYYLGYFSTAQAAHEAYVQAKRLYHTTCVL